MVFHDAERSLLLSVAWFSWKGIVFMVFHDAESSFLLTVAWFSLSWKVTFAVSCMVFMVFMVLKGHFYCQVHGLHGKAWFSWSLMRLKGCFCWRLHGFHGLLWSVSHAYSSLELPGRQAVSAIFAYIIRGWTTLVGPRSDFRCFSSWHYSWDLNWKYLVGPQPPLPRKPGISKTQRKCKSFLGGA